MKHLLLRPFFVLIRHFGPRLSDMIPGSRNHRQQSLDDEQSGARGHRHSHGTPPHRRSPTPGWPDPQPRGVPPMSAEKPLMTQLVELLGISQATAWPPSTEEVVIITVRPQPDSFRPHNIALKKAQAVRLLRDLESLLRSPAMVLVACLAVSAGCSARVGVERGSDTDATATETSSTQISRTTVEVDFQPRSPQPVPQPKPPPVTVRRPGAPADYGHEQHRGHQGRRHAQRNAHPRPRRTPAVRRRNGRDSPGGPSRVPAR